MEKKEVKMRDNFFSKLSHRYAKPFQKKYYYYFLWKNKLNNSQTDFNITQEEFVNKYLKKKVNGKIGDGEKSFKLLIIWESTDEYQELMQEYYKFKMNQDFYKLYETYLEKAMQGDEKALNALKTIKKEIESLNKVQRSTKVEDEPKYDMN